MAKAGVAAPDDKVKPVDSKSADSKSALDLAPAQAWSGISSANSTLVNYDWTVLMKELQEVPATMILVARLSRPLSNTFLQTLHDDVHVYVSEEINVTRPQQTHLIFGEIENGLSKQDFQSISKEWQDLLNQEKAQSQHAGQYQDVHTSIDWILLVSEQELVRYIRLQKLVAVSFSFPK